jgi:hypothetical protein
MNAFRGPSAFVFCRLGVGLCPLLLPQRRVFTVFSVPLPRISRSSPAFGVDRHLFFFFFSFSFSGSSTGGVIHYALQPEMAAGGGG